MFTDGQTDRRTDGRLIAISPMDGWVTCDFTSFLTVFQSYQDDVWVIMKGCVQWNSNRSARSVGQRLTH